MNKTLLKDPFFYTREQSIKFHVNPSCLLSIEQVNCDEVCSSGGRKPRDIIIINDGVDIRYSLEDAQKVAIIAKINQLTQNDIDYCLENDVIYLSSNHVVNDYCINNPEVLSERGWPIEEDELLVEVMNILCNVSEVVKVKVKFDENGDSLKRLNYTVTGTHNDYNGTLVITFQERNDTESLLTVTVLERRKIQ